MKKINVILIFVFALLITGCPKQPNTDVIEPNDNGVVPVIDTDWCDKAETNLEKLGCTARDGSSMSDGFTEICHRVQEEGGIFLNPKCVATAATCDVAKSCPPS